MRERSEAKASCCVAAFAKLKCDSYWGIADNWTPMTEMPFRDAPIYGGWLGSLTRVFG